jgi:hypothetical protein
VTGLDHRRHLVVAATTAVSPCPDREQQEDDRGGERDRTLRQRQAEEVSDGDGQAVHHERGDADAGQHDPPPMAQGVGHRHQLGLIAEFGDEDHRQTDQCGGEH